MKASVIVPTYGRPTYLEDVLTALLQQDFPIDAYEIIVVDNQPRRDVRSLTEQIGQEGNRPLHYQPEEKVGLHNARHAGARVAKGEILVYVDDDVTMEPQWLEAMLAPFSDPAVAIVGGKVAPKWEGSEPPVWVSQFPSTYLSLLDLGNERLELEWPKGVYGCNMAVRREVLYKVGGFHPDGIGRPHPVWLRGDGETGLHEKVFAAGYKVVYEPAACLYHRIPAARLQPSYFRRRAFRQGISDSYSQIRRLPSRGRMIIHALECLWRAFRIKIAEKRRRPQSERKRANAWYWYGRGQHQIRVALNPKLYRYVLQESYL